MRYSKSSSQSNYVGCFFIQNVWTEVSMPACHMYKLFIMLKVRPAQSIVQISDS